MGIPNDVRHPVLEFPFKPRGKIMSLKQTLEEITAQHPANNFTNQFDDMITVVTEERGAVYGHPYDNFHRIEMLKNALKDCDNYEIRHAMEMICVNLARLVETPNHIDSIIDIAGYARTMAMVLDEQEKRRG